MAEHFTAARFIAAIPGTGGIITNIARNVGCDWHTVKRYILKHPTVWRAWQDERERIGDLGETQIVRAMTRGDMQTVRWYMSTIHRDRGYVTRQELEHSGRGGGPVLTKAYMIVSPDDWPEHDKEQS